MPFGNVTNNTGNLPQLDGTYTLEVIRIEDMEPGQYGDRMRWVFEATDEDGDLVTYESGDRKSTRLNSSHVSESRMPSSA